MNTDTISLGGIEIAQALIKFQSECPEISLDSDVSIKKKDGGTFKFKFASLPHIVKTIRPTLKKCGLAVFHQTGDEGVKAVLIHSSGQTLSTGWLKPPQSSDPKTIGANITYLRRYTLSALLGLVVEDDNDTKVQDSKISGKKPISQAAFEQAVTRIKNGETQVLIQVLIHFEMDEEQLQQIIDLTFQVREFNS